MGFAFPIAFITFSISPQLFLEVLSEPISKAIGCLDVSFSIFKITSLKNSTLTQL